MILWASRPQSSCDPYGSSSYLLKSLLAVSLHSSLTRKKRNSDKNQQLMTALWLKLATVKKAPNISTKFAHATEPSAVMVGLRTVETRTTIAREEMADVEGGEDVAEVVVDLNTIVIPVGVVVVGVEDPEEPETMEGTMAETVVALLRPFHEGLARAPPHGEAIGRAAGAALLLVLLPEHPQEPHMADLGPHRLLRLRRADRVHALYPVHHHPGSDTASPKADAAQAPIHPLVLQQESVSVRLRTLVLLHHHVADALALPIDHPPRDHEGHAGSIFPDRVPAAHHPLGDIAAV